ncbi:sulfite exporter TauE/SafE family protein [Tepidimonas charontis]|uniref:Probable membrane transporter protein n=1 Tax=Tepidimonas charontis TaxID=2267262 RepID=A0A554XHD7_9BURK|nr:sulfite exporter TauE/SafE family protein [Tepidimonas charontis]TSE35251.1 Sulfite exporter TauE/SafE [Tepidimonas charontis]
MDLSALPLSLATALATPALGQTLALGAAVGIVMGLTGAGGGILAVPLLVLGLHLPLTQAAPTGLIAVCAAATLAALLGLREGIVRYRAAAWMGVLGMLGAPAGVWLAARLPATPLLLAFSALLLYVAWRSWRGPAHEALDTPPDQPCRLDPVQGRLRWTTRCARALGATGLAAGVLSGLFGVGGGFVIIPALQRFSDLDWRSIQATSLAVIALVSASGVAAGALHGALPWPVAAPFGSAAVAALLAARTLARHVHPKVLRRAFGLLTLGVALLMLMRAAGYSLG